MKQLFFLLIPAALFSGCSSDSFRVEGNVEEGAGKTIVLEKPDLNGYWMPLDSAKISNSDKFSFKSPRPAGPEIYRLRLDNRYVYFPVDSTENISVSTNINSFGHLYTLSGSADAESMSRFENEFAHYASREAVADSAAAFKRRIFSEYLLPGKASVVSYYILTKTMADGKPLYDMTNREDHKYLAAVATAFRQFAPEDPHTAMLEQFALQALRAENKLAGKQQEIAAEEISLLPISLPDETGAMRSLQSVAGKGNRVLLVFSSLTDTDSPARNRELMRAARNGWTIFQVSFDTDQYAWREAAANLPWTTVNDPSASPRSASDYNVSNLPVYYTIDAAGNLYNRGSNLKNLGI